MKNEFTINDVSFHIGGYTPRKNEYERGLQYALFTADNICRGNFSTKHAAKQYAAENAYIWKR